LGPIVNEHKRGVGAGGGRGRRRRDENGVEEQAAARIQERRVQARLRAKQVHVARHQAL
jgi:hypothetical protein